LLVAAIVVVLAFIGLSFLVLGGDDGGGEVDSPIQDLGEEEDGSGSGGGSSDDAVPTAEVGDCVTDRLVGVGSVTGFEVVSCDEAHAAELYLAFDLPDAEQLPEPDALESTIEDRCGGPDFQAYVGAPPDPQGLTWSPVAPTEATWAEGDREVLCFVVEADGSERTTSARTTD